MKLKNKKIIVTGGAGFIGSNLVKTLINLNNEVVVIDNFSQGKKENLKEVLNHKNLRIVKTDILDRKNILKLLKGSDIVFHLAVQCLRVSLKEPYLVNEVNATGSLNVLWSAYKNKVKRFIYCSSSEVYGTAKNSSMKEDHETNPTTTYGASKLIGEIYTKCFNQNYGLNTVIVRPFNTYGYNEHMVGPYGEVIPRFIVRLKNNLPPIIFGDGKQTRDFTFVSDTVNGLILAAESDKAVGQIINIAQGKEVSVKKIAEILNNQLNKKIKIIHQPARPHDVMRHIADISKAKKLLNFSPEVDIESGIKMYLTYLNKQKINYNNLIKQIPERNW